MLYFAVAAFYVGRGADFDPLIWSGYTIGIPGIAAYYVVGVQYMQDARSVLVDAKRDGGASG